VAWQVYAARHSAFDLGLVGLTLFAPSFVLAPVTGLVADRVDRRAIVAAGALAECAISAVLMASWNRHGTGAVAALLGVLLIAGVSRAFVFPAEQSLLPSIVPPETYPRATARAAVFREVVRIAGPALGGVLVAAGAAPAYGTAIVLSVAGAAVVPFVVMRTVAAAPSGRSGWREAIAGLRFVSQRPVLYGAISLDLFAVLFGGATALLPIYATAVLHAGAVGFGVLRASTGVGAAACAAVLARRPINRHAGPRLLTAVACYGAATIVFGLSRSLLVSVVALALVGAADMVSVVIREGIVQLGTPDEMRGRVSAVEGVFIVASNELGEFESGMLASLAGAVPAVVAGGLLTVAVAAVWAGCNPELRSADRYGDARSDVPATR